MTTELARLLHGECPPSAQHAINSALVTARPHRDAGRHGSIAQIGRLAASLPGIREQHSDIDTLACLLSQTAVADPSLFMSALLHYTLCGGSIANLGTTQEAQVHLDALDSGAAKGVYLITEIGTSGSLTGASTRAVYEPRTREFVLTTPDPQGLKFSSVAPDGGPVIAVLFARLIHEGRDEGVYPFIVPLTGTSRPLPGVEISQPFTVSALPLRYGVMRLQRVRIPYGNWLSGGGSISDSGVFHDPTPGGVRLTRSLAAGGASMYATLPSSMAAIARVGAARAIRYAENRSTQDRLTSGARLLSYRTQQVSLFGALADAIALTAVARQARATLERECVTDRAVHLGPWTSVHPDAPVYKAISTEGAVRVIRECRERCGLHGMLDANELSPYQGLAEAFVTAGGDNRLILIDSGIALAESPDPPPEAPPPGDDVTAPDWWPSVCLAHRTSLAAGTRKELSRAKGQWPHLLHEAHALGQAHAHHLATEALNKTLASIADPDLKAALEKLSALYGVMQACRLAGPLVASGALRTTAVRSLMPAAVDLCDQISPHLPLLYEIGELSHQPHVPLDSVSYATALTSIIPLWHKGGPA
ncbi:acyl-CoA dehydrogenase [Streptomyces sp. 5-10]|uniref:acyl-CoA dehydrogenase family protein n=1 Tax=Streptomyces sp. 5-10 TaxID=878925 RepID=UPI00168AF1E1|nr:acyl-CoA dehydrogenase [Streptomyces sp. 5-10]MBD3004848.1 acyl-CoA oxidase [Streptomyces sp. 5-10]